MEKENPVAVQRIVSSLQELHNLGKPKTDQEVEDRIKKYFEFCEHSSIRPGIESLCLALHITRQTLFRWNVGEDCTERRKEAIQSAKSFISAFIEQASISGRLNPATSIFLMKNWMNYKDTISMEQVAANDRPINKDIPDIPELEKKYNVDLNKNKFPEFPEFE